MLEETNAEISGRRVWPGSALLSLAMCDPSCAPEVNFSGATVLELGAGSGLVGITAARLGAARVVITDGDQTSVDLARQNLAANVVGNAASAAPPAVSVDRLLWGGDAHQDAVLLNMEAADCPGAGGAPAASTVPTYSVVLAGDVLYKESLPPLFFATLKRHLALDGRALLCHLVRAGVTHDLVVAAATAAGFVVSQVPLPSSALPHEHCPEEEVALARIYQLRHAGDDDRPPPPPGAEASDDISGPPSAVPTACGAGQEAATDTWLTDVHVSYVLALREKTHTFEHVATEHLRMSGVYWGLTAMALMGRDGDMHSTSPSASSEELVNWVMQCQHPNGGFSGNVGHDAHILYTLSAVQILAMCDALDRIDVDLVAKYFAGLQQADGSFVGDEWGEVDTRFSYCALSGLSILGRLKINDGAADGEQLIDVDAATRFVASCKNFDGGFGCIPGAESHAGQIFCCVAALSIGGALHLVDHELLGWWLAERQCDSGGLNGRPEKQADVCYSWWILSALSILGKVDWIDTARLANFILDCQVRHLSE